MSSSVEARKLDKRLHRLVAQALLEFNMIEAGDKVMVCLSGGKDSYALLDILLGLRRRSEARAPGADRQPAAGDGPYRPVASHGPEPASLRDAQSDRRGIGVGRPGVRPRRPRGDPAAAAGSRAGARCAGQAGAGLKRSAGGDRPGWTAQGDTA